MRFSTEEELEITSDEVIDEVQSDDHDGDAAALAAVAQNGSRGTGAAIILLTKASLDLAIENTADAQVAIAAYLSAATILNNALQAAIAEADFTLAVTELETQGPVGFLLSRLGFASGGVVSP